MSTFAIDPNELQSLLDRIEQLDTETLHVLDEAIVKRINRLSDERRQSHMANFSVGDAVSFTDKNGNRVSATVIRLNKKTASLVTDDGKRWNVTPELLTPEAVIALEEENSPTEKHQPVELSILPGGGEWVGGLLEVPGYVMEGDTPRRPAAIVWIDSDGMVQGLSVCWPEEVSQVVISSLEAALNSPQFGQPKLPSKIRTANSEMAELLQGHYHTIEIVISATPELDELENSMLEQANRDQNPPTYLDQGLQPQVVASFFKNQAMLYTAAPWKKIPTDECLFSVTIESLNVHNSVLSVIGQAGIDHGLLLFDSIEDYELYLLAGDCAQRITFDDTLFNSLQYRALTFENGAKLDGNIRKEIAANNWPVADAYAYPVLFTPDTDQTIRPITKNDLDVFEALAQAVVYALKDIRVLKKSWSTGEMYRQTITVTTYFGEAEVQLATPFTYSAQPNAIQKMASLIRSTGEFDSDKHELLVEDICQQFQVSPECRELGYYAANSDLLMKFTQSYFEETIATAMPSTIEDILFEVFPRKVMMKPSEAQEVIMEIRSFYSFLKREFALTQADACLQLLNDSAVGRLKDALSDPTNTGLSKSILNFAADSGFDIESPEGLERFMQQAQGMRVPDSIQLPGLEAPAKPIDSSRNPSKRKKKRKAPRKARKNSR